MFWLFVITICGVNLAPLMLPQLDMWHAQGLWVQTGILALFGWSFFESSDIKVVNKPLGMLFCWIGLSTLFFCFVGQANNRYDTAHFFPFFNFLCMILLYTLTVRYLDDTKIEKILKYMRTMFIGTLFLCVLQYFGLSQFFDFLHKEEADFGLFRNNLVTGFIGNGTHLSGFLASCIPLLFLKWKRINWLYLGLTLLVLTQSGTSKNDPSISGFIVFICVVAFYLYHERRKAFWWCTVIGLTVGSCLILTFGESKEFLQLITPHGRIVIWKHYWQIFKILPLTGSGLGAVNLLYKEIVAFNARHLHLEYFHFLFELGIIGLGLILYVIKDFFRTKIHNKTELVLQCMVLGFCVSCCFNFPAHLWLPATYAMFAYACVHALKVRG